MKKLIHTSDAPEAIGPYSQAIICGDTLYASGQIPIDPTSGKIESDDITEQAHRAMKNVGAVLAAAKLGYDDVVKTTVYLADLGDFGTVNAVYGEYFRAPYPARSCVQAAALPRGAKIEVEILARIK